MNSSLQLRKKYALPQISNPIHLLLSLAGLGLLLALLFSTSRVPLPSLLRLGHFSLAAQVLVGAGAGAFLAGGLAVAVLATPWGAAQSMQMADSLRAYPGQAACLLASAAAAVLSEMLFRAALQPLVGIWAAAAFYAAWEVLSGQFPLFAGRNVVGSLICLGIGLSAGLLYQHLGLASALIAQAGFRVIFILLVSPGLDLGFPRAVTR